MQNPNPATAAPPRSGRRGRPRKHTDAYGTAASARISVRNCINWTYARQAADALGFAVLNSGPRPIAAGPPNLRAITGTTVLTEIGRSLEIIGPERTVTLAHRVARLADAAGLDANGTAKLIRQLRNGADETPDGNPATAGPTGPTGPAAQDGLAPLKRLAG